MFCLPRVNHVTDYILTAVQEFNMWWVSDLDIFGNVLTSWSIVNTETLRPYRRRGAWRYLLCAVWKLRNMGKYFHRCKGATYYIYRHPIYPNDLQPVTKFPGLVELRVSSFFCSCSAKNLLFCAVHVFRVFSRLPLPVLFGVLSPSTVSIRTP